MTTIEKELLKSLIAVLPYAEDAVSALQAANSEDDVFIDEAERALAAIESARKAIAMVTT